MPKSKPKKPSHLHYFFSAIALSLLGVAGVLCVGFYSLNFSQATTNEVTISAVRYMHGLDGTAVKKKSDTAFQVVGVMIDNHPDAYPQAGISKAKIVYETMVEGGITRYFAIFDSKQNIAEVGPVRSARLYFLDWISEYGDGLYVHSGGSPQALAAIAPRKIFDANEFFLGQYFWRSSSYFAPHNLFISSDNWNKIIAKNGSKNKLFTADKAWKYSNIVGKTIGKSGKIIIPFSIGYDIMWSYDAKNLNYLRSINGRVHIDKDKSEVRARNIVVQFADVSAISNDDAGRQEIETVGSGDAIILKKGSVTYGTWKKKSTTDRTRFYDKAGKEIVLTPGNTWVEVVPKETKAQVGV
ncbi:MAG: DUF3048 domain-containing protein [Candidatus Magasanikbacteria bacterium]|nr:DUF3048 domain-containing protein [Candidatus Magasanikbacteria bacterium]